MEEKGECKVCSRSHKSVNLVVCVKTKNLMCRDCCVKENKGMGSCMYWNFCWPNYYI